LTAKAQLIPSKDPYRTGLAAKKKPYLKGPF
jgi:hypothetical protein